MISRMIKSVRGFTMIELLVAATIIAVLSAIGFVSFSQAGITARNGKRKADLEQVRAALELYRSGPTAAYPNPGGSGTAAWTSVISTLNSGGYISLSPIVDPKGVGDATYNYTYVTPSPAGGVATRTYRICAAHLEVSGSTGPVYCVDSP